jgi:26S proteasome regulatory subunit N9
MARTTPLACGHLSYLTRRYVPHPDPAEAQAFLEGIAAQLKAKADFEAALLCKMQIARCKLRRGADFHADVKAELDEQLPVVEALVGAEPVVHSAYYRVACDYYGAKGPASKFYKNALMLLAYTQYDEMPPQERFDLAVNISIAAMTGDGVFNFGEVVREAFVSQGRISGLSLF